MSRSLYPPEWLGLKDEETLEIAITAPGAPLLQLDLTGELQQLPAVQVLALERRGIDIPQLIYLTGAASGIIPAIDVIARWLKTKQNSRRDIQITIRTAQGQVELNAENPTTARDLASRLKDATKPKKKAGREGSQMEEKYPYFDGRHHLATCRDVLSAFKAQLEDNRDLRLHQREKYGVLVPVIDVGRLSDEMQSDIKNRENDRKRYGPADVAKVLTLIEELLRDYDTYNETFKPPKRR